MSSDKCSQCGNSLPVESTVGICPACESVVEQTLIKKDDATSIAPCLPGRDSKDGDPNLAETVSPSDGEQKTDFSVDGGAVLLEATPDGGTRRFGDYEILDEIARGGMGVVFRARQVSLNRPVALKMILSAQLASQADVKRFYIEAESAAKLEHPGIVPIYEVGEHDGQHFFSMGLVEGGSLADLVQDGPLPPRKAAEMVRAVAEAVQYAHARNIVHRDLKPANVLLDEQGQPKVADFGLAKNVEQDSGLTATGQVMGTPAYMPPEQASGRMDEVGPLADVYSLGAILYFMLTGRPPFQGVSIVETLQLVVKQEAVSPRQYNDKVDLDLATICLKCLEKDARQRYGSAGELADELGRYLRHEPIVARPLGRAARFGRWSRRNPVVASLIGLSVVLLAGGTVVATYFAVVANTNARLANNRAGELDRSNIALTTKKDELSQSNEQLGIALGLAEDERTKAQQARESERVLKEEFRRQLYLADMHLAQQAFDAGNIARVKELLEKYRPRPWAAEKTPDLRGFEWYHWWQASHLDRNRFYPEGHPVRRLVGSPDGKRVAFQIDGGPYFIYDCTAGGGAGRYLDWFNREKQFFKDGEFCFSPDGALLAVGAEQGEIIIFQTDDGKLVQRLQNGHDSQHDWEEDYSFSGLSVAFSPDETLLASGDESGKIVLWNRTTSQPLATLQSNGRVRSLAFAPDGALLVAGMENHQVVVWDVASRKSKQLTDHKELVNCVQYSCDGLLATGSYDGTIQLWDKKLESHRRLAAHGPVQSLAFSPDGNYLAAGTASNSVLVWRIDPAPAATLIHTIKGHSKRIHGVAFNADSSNLWSASEDGYVKVWDLSHCEQSLTLRGRGARSLAYAADGRVLFMDDKGILQEWSAATRAPTELLDSTARYVHASISHNGEHLAGITSADELIVRNLTTGKQSHPRSVGSGDDLEIVVDNEGQRVAWASGDSSSPETVIFDVATGKEMSLHGAGWPKGFSPDGTQLVSCGLTPTISGASFFTKTWGVTSDPPQLILPFDHYGPANCAAFSPDATLLAIGTWDNMIRLHDAATGKLIHTLKGHTGEVLSVAFSPIGNMLVSGSADTTVRIWNADTGELRSTLSGHQDVVVSVAFSHDRHSNSPFSNSVASRSRAGTVKIWATATQADVEDNTDAWLERARYYYREHEPAEAFVALMEVLKRKPRHVTALRFREKLLLQQGKDLLAIAVDDLPQSWEVRLSIAKLAAERQSWKRSAAIYLAAAKAGTDVSFFWLAGAAVLVKSGDLDGYQAYCHKMLEHFEGKSTPIATAIVVDACLFVPPDESIRKASLEMADRLATLQATIPWQMRYVEMVQGMAEYRRGNFEEAVDWCRKCLAAKQISWFSTVQAHLVLAMARAQLGEFGKAQQALKSGSEILSDKNKQFQADGFGDFRNWIICNTLLAEAEGEVQRAGR